jgi:SnoaL-like domain
VNQFLQRAVRPGEDFRHNDRLEVLDTLWRNRVALDIRDEEMFRGTLASTVTADLSENPVCWTGGPQDWGPTEFTRDGWAANFFGPDRPPHDPSVPQGYSGAHHGLLNPLVTFTSEDTAVTLGYNHEHIHRWSNEGGKETAWSTDIAGYYHHDYVREEGRWRICYVRIMIKFFQPDELYSLYPPRPAQRPS